MTDPLLLAETLAATHHLPDAGLAQLLSNRTPETAAFLQEQAAKTSRAVFGSKVYIRGLIEFTNFCRNDCYYCGIRRSNRLVARYRLPVEAILRCCDLGYRVGFRTFVLQGGEDAWFTDDRLCCIISEIKSHFPDCAVTLSVGERSTESYQRLFDAGADRYLLRHETANPAHYAALHPPELSLAHRIDCLFALKKTGYQVGCGMMVGSPGQTVDMLVEDLQFLEKFHPHMVGIGPFLPHPNTPLGGEPNGSAELTLYLLSIIRLMLPKALLPATTALGSALAGGRELGILHGANVVMPNLSPSGAREKYELYPNKLSTGAESGEGLYQLEEKLSAIGYHIAVSRGDSPMD